jgi:hypothetical protein
VIRRDAGTELERAVRTRFAGLAATLEVESLTSRPWASITFSGARHRLALRIGGCGAAAAADSFLADVAKREFELRGHILADIALVDELRDAGGARLTLEALTLEAD